MKYLNIPNSSIASMRSLSLLVWALSCFVDKFFGLSLVYVSLVIIFWNFISSFGCFSFISSPIQFSKISLQQYLFLCAICICAVFTFLFSTDLLDSLKYLCYAFFFLFVTIRLRESLLTSSKHLSSNIYSLNIYRNYIRG